MLAREKDLFFFLPDAFSLLSKCRVPPEVNDIGIEVITVVWNEFICNVTVVLFFHPLV